MSNLCKIGKVFRIKAQTCLSEASFCGLGKRERFLVEEMQLLFPFEIFPSLSKI